MIRVRGYEGHKVAVLGVARSGRPAIEALRAGGAEVVAWDDSPAAREAAEADGIPLADLTKPRSYEGVKALIVSPGIPHLYPAPHPAIVTAWDMGVAVDNDIGLFFRSFATPDWESFDRMPTVVAITGSNGKSTTTALTAHVMQEAGRPTQVGGNIGRGVLDLDPAAEGMVVVSSSPPTRSTSPARCSPTSRSSSTSPPTTSTATAASAATSPPSAASSPSAARPAPSSASTRTRAASSPTPCGRTPPAATR